MIFQIEISKPSGGGGRRLAEAFTEHGVAMLSSVLAITATIVILALTALIAAYVPPH